LAALHVLSDIFAHHQEYLLMLLMMSESIIWKM